MEEVENEDMEKLLSIFTEELGGSQLDPSFFQDDNNIKKKQQQNTATQK